MIGGLFGAVLAFIMQSVSPNLIPMAMESSGLIEQVVTNPPLDMGFLKILIILVVFGAYLGYVIEVKMKK